VVTRIGTTGVALVFAAGLWLVAAPFALGYQRAGTGWTGATRTDVIAGGLLAVAGFAGIFAVIAGQVSELYADPRSAASLAAPGTGRADGRTTGS